jgi:type I restriction enzyme S subunit
VPSLAVQCRIAGILSAYDDLIENCERRIRVLDEMARALYREWFVLFRYPGHEKMTLVDSPLGRIPKGWTVSRLDDVCSHITDGAHASPKTVEAGLPMASSKDMHDWGLDLSTTRLIAEQDFDSLVRNGCKPMPGDVLVTKDGANYLKRIFVFRDVQDVVLLSSVAILRAGTNVSPALLAATLRTPETRARLKNYVTGAAIPRIVLKDFKAFQFVLPAEEIRALWAQFGEPFDVACWQLAVRAENLRKTRDFLLPRLLSGQLSVEDVA